MCACISDLPAIKRSMAVTMIYPKIIADIYWAGQVCRQVTSGTREIEIVTNKNDRFVIIMHIAHVHGMETSVFYTLKSYYKSV